MAGLTLKERQRQVREEAILVAAHELLTEQGYTAMSMDDLAARVGVSKATLYQHFPSKEELAVNVVLHGMRRSEALISEMHGARPALERLEMMLRQAIEGRQSLSMAQVSFPPLLLKRHPLYQAQHEHMVELIRAMVDEAKADGSIKQNIPTPIIIQMILSNIREASYGDLITGGVCTLPELSDAIVNIILNGLRTRPAAPSNRPVTHEPKEQV